MSGTLAFSIIVIAICVLGVVSLLVLGNLLTEKRRH